MLYGFISLYFSGSRKYISETYLIQLPKENVLIKNEHNNTSNQT